MAKTATTAETSKTCACGCGEPVVRLFKQGHDQRLVSNLASDLVHMDVWDGKCMGILKGAIVRGDQQEKIDRVTAYVREKISDGLAAKVWSAAMRTWDLQKNKDAKEAAKAERKAAAAAKPKRTAKAKAAPSEEAGSAREPKLITKAVASNADVDAAEAAADTNSGGTYTTGQGIRVLIGKRKRNATVHGMNQAGKVTAIALVNGGKEQIKTDGFQIVND